MDSPSATFGSSDVARKTTACIACRKRKVRCHMTNERPPCARCKTRGLECTFKKSVQTLLQNDAEWKHGVEERIEIIERSLAANSALATTRTTQDIAQMRQDHALTRQISSPLSPQNGTTSTGLNLSCSLGSFPASSINGTTQNDSPRVFSSLAAPVEDSSTPESSQQRLFTNPITEKHIKFYQNHLDPLIHYILVDGESFSSLKLRSEFLAIAVCTVAAQCAGTDDYNDWLELFKTLVAVKTFSKQHAFDDVRALCIGALWLSDIATALSALGKSSVFLVQCVTANLHTAVRLSSELNLHRCVTKAPFTKDECYERTRLYFLVYIVDHHCSLCYGRPPMTRELSSMKDSRVLLECKFSNPHRGDLSLVSQIELWNTNAKVFDTFGADIEGLSPSLVNSIDQLSRLYNEWHKDWQPILSPLNHLLGNNRQISMHSSYTTCQTANLYLSAAKLHLFAHIFRGPAQRNPQPPIILDPRSEYNRFASYAIQSALDHLHSLTLMLDSGMSFGILPVYLAMMAAFSTVFLLRISISQHNPIASEHNRSVYVQTIERLRDALQKDVDKSATHSATNSTSQSLVSKITDALKTATDLKRGSATNSNQIQSEYLSTMETQENNLNFHDAHGALNASGLNIFSMEGPMDFDFSFMDFDNFAWDDAAEQTGQIDLTNPTLSTGV